MQNNNAIPPIAFIGLIGAYGPTIAAIIVQSVLDKKRLKPLFKRLIQFRSQWKLLLFVIVVPIILYIIAYLISALINDGDLKIHWMLGISNITSGS